MKKYATPSWMPLVFAGLALLGANGTPARAAGINLSWDDCGAAGQEIQAFACNSNTGVPFEFIGSFDPPSNITEWLGLSARVTIQFTRRTDVPDWWALAAGGCRAGALSVNYDFTSGPFTCTDLFGGQAVGGYIYESGPRSNSTQIRMQAAIASENAVALEPGTEYYAFRVKIQRPRTSGAGACVGCADIACITLEEIQLFQPPEQANDPQIMNPILRQEIGWQERLCPPCACPATRISLGELKCRYR